MKMLIDKGNGKDLEYGHTDYKTGEGRFVTRSENQRERYINPELTTEQRYRISTRDMLRRNQYMVSLFYENNVQIQSHIQYNPCTESLSLSWSIRGQHGKKVGRLN